MAAVLLLGSPNAKLTQCQNFKVTVFFRMSPGLHILKSLDHWNLFIPYVSPPPVLLQLARFDTPKEENLFLPVIIRQASPGYLSDHVIVLSSSILPPPKQKDTPENKRCFPLK